jgi:hypothetical protein
LESKQIAGTPSCDRRLRVAAALRELAQSTSSIAPASVATSAALEPYAQHVPGAYEQAAGAPVEPAFMAQRQSAS